MKPIPLFARQSLIAFGVFIVTAFVSFWAASDGLLLKSTPYASRDAAADARLSSLTQGKGAGILDWIVASVKTKAITQAGSPVDNDKYVTYLDDYLSKLSKLDDTVRLQYWPDYTFLFQYVYPRVYELRWAYSVSVSDIIGQIGGLSGSGTSALPTASWVLTPTPKIVEPLVITTSESLPQVITYQTQNIQLEYSGGDGSEPFWMPCIQIPSSQTDGLKVSSHGIIMGSIAGSEKSEDHICVTLWVGNQKARKTFFYKIIPTTKATMSILSPEKLHTGTIGKKYTEAIESTEEINGYGNYYDAEGKRDCNRTASIEKVSGTLPPGLVIHNENDRPGGWNKYGRKDIAGIPTTAGTYDFSLKYTLENNCEPVKLTDTKNMTIVIEAPGNEDPDAPKIIYFMTRVTALWNYTEHNTNFLQSNSTFAVPKNLELTFTMITNCEVSREAWYYLINIDGEDFSKNGEKVKYELKGSNLNNLCEVTGHWAKGYDTYNRISVTPEELGLTEGSHKIVIRGCTKDGHCSAVSDGLPLCTEVACKTSIETDEMCYMIWGTCTHHPTVNMPAFVLNVAPVTLGAYTATTPKNSFDELALMQDESLSNAKAVLFLGIDYSKSPKLCRQDPKSDLCATGQGTYEKPITLNKNVAYAIVAPGAMMQSGADDPYGRYDWFVRYGNETPIKIGGYTKVPDNREFEYKWACSSYFGMVKNEMPWDKYASITVPKNEACSLDYRKKHLGQVVAGGGAVGSYNPIFKDTEWREAFCTCEEYEKGVTPIYW